MERLAIAFAALSLGTAVLATEVTSCGMCAAAQTIVGTEAAPQPASASLPVTREFALRARAAIRRQNAAARRASVAVYRTRAELFRRTANASVPISVVSAPDLVDETLPETFTELGIRIERVEALLKQIEDYKRVSLRLRGDLETPSPAPQGVPEWAEEVSNGSASWADLQTVRARVLHIEALAFRSEQGAQEAEICAEQAIGLADLSQAMLPPKGLQQKPMELNWRFLGPAGIPEGEGFNGTRVPVSGRVTAIAISRGPAGNQIYAGAAGGGVWRSDNACRQWTALSDHQGSLAIGALTLVADNPNAIYAGTGEANVAFRDYVVTGDRVLPGREGVGLLKSIDGGANWTVQGADVFAGAAFAEIASESTGQLLLAATTRGLFKSTDGGDNWAEEMPSLNSGVPVSSVVMHKQRPNEAYAAVWGMGVYRTTNLAGASGQWKRLEAGLPLSNIGRIRLAWPASNPAVLYALFATADHKMRGLYETRDAGATWSKIDGVPDVLRSQGFYHMLLGAHVAEPNVIYVGGGGERGKLPSSLYRGTRIDGRWYFKPVGGEMHIDFHAVAFDSQDPDRVVVSNDGGVWRSDDNGETWVPCNDGLAVTQITKIAQHPTRADFIVAGTQDNGTLVLDGAAPWHHGDDGDGGFVAVDQHAPGNVYSEFIGYRIALSKAAGRYGTYLPIHPALGNVSAAFLSPFDLNPRRPGEIALGADRVYISPDQGETWRSIDYRFTEPSPRPHRAVLSALRYAQADAIDVGTSTGDLFRVRRDQDQWNVERLASGEALGQMTMVTGLSGSVDRPDVIYVATDAKQAPALWKVEMVERSPPRLTSIAGGAADETLKGPIYSVEARLHERGLLFAATPSGVVWSVDAGRSWRSLGNGLPNVAVTDVQLHPTLPLLRVGTFGRGVWELDLTTVLDRS